MQRTYVTYRIKAIARCDGFGQVGLHVKLLGELDRRPNFGGFFAVPVLEALQVEHDDHRKLAH